MRLLSDGMISETLLDLLRAESHAVARVKHGEAADTALWPQSCDLA